MLAKLAEAGWRVLTGLSPSVARAGAGAGQAAAITRAPLAYVAFVWWGLGKVADARDQGAAWALTTNARRA